MRERHLGLREGLLGLLAFGLARAYFHVGLMKPLVQRLHQSFRLGRLSLVLPPGFFERLHFLLDALDFIAANGDFLVQALPATLMPLDARSQVGRLLSQDGDLILLLLERGVRIFQLVAQRLPGVFGFGDALIQVAQLLAQLAPFTFARQNTGLGMMRADGQSAVGFQ